MKNENTVNSLLQGIRSAGAPLRPPGLGDDVAALWDELHGLVHAHSLAARESQGVRDGLVAIVAHGVAIGVLVAIASLVAAVAMLLWLAP
jgi:hypothetical protein